MIEDKMTLESHFTQDWKEIEAALRCLPKQLFFNDPAIQRFFYDNYKDYLAAFQALIIRDRLGPIVVVPMGIDAGAPQFDIPSWCYLPAIGQIGVAIAATYPINPKAKQAINGDWLDLLPDWYIDTDILLHVEEEAPDKRAAIPTASISLEDKRLLWESYSKSRRKSLKRNMQVLERYDLRPGTLDDLEQIRPDVVRMWEEREANSKELRWFLPMAETMRCTFDFLKLASIHPFAKLIITSLFDKVSGQLEAVNVVLGRDRDLSNGYMVYDDYLVWKRYGNEDPLGIVMTLHNIWNLPDVGLYNMGSPYFSAEVIPHHQYKLDLIPESLREDMHLVSTFPAKRVAEVIGMLPPYRAAGTWITDEEQV